MNATHEFALYYSLLQHYSLKKDAHISIDDKDLIHRIMHVLRLKENESFKLFDQTNHATVRIDAVQKKAISLTVIDHAPNHILKPHITFYLPLLKRESLESAIYSCVEVGANQIQLIITKKIHRAWQNKEMERLQKIAIAAAEQSKNFAFPEICSPQTLQEALKTNKAGVSIFFDPTGKNPSDIIKKAQLASKIALMVGPEADLEAEEKEALLAQNWLFCPLTPTVLQAQTAVSLGLGLFRTLVI